MVVSFLAVASGEGGSTVNVGFWLYYQKNDATLMAIQLARRLGELGYDVEFYPADRAQAVHPFWDRCLHRGRLNFYDWLKKYRPSYVIFGKAPPPEYVQATQNAGARAYVLGLWDEIGQEDLPALNVATRVVSPSRAAQQLLAEQLELTNVVYVPWDPGVPITHDDRHVDPAHVGLYWPITGGQCFRQEPEVISLLCRVARKLPQLCLTVTYSSSLGAGAAKELKKLTAAAGGRVELLKNLSWEKEQLLYGHHDLTAWPTVVEGVGLVGLSSVYMGTPVIAFDHPLVGEIIKDGRNGLLVPCELGYNWLKVPYVEPNYDTFEANLVELLQDTDRLEHLRETATHGLSQRREMHTALVDELFT